MGTSIAFLLPAVILTYVSVGDLTFQLGGILAPHVSIAMGAFLLFLFIFGVGKAALMPLHRWLPAAMVAPTPVSALLHAVAVVKAGVFTVVKVILYVFGMDYLQQLFSGALWQGGWLLYLSGFTVVMASLIALKQDNLKKRLAYSTISQLSYVIMAAAILAPQAMIAAIFHIAAHAFGKITLFFAAGNIATSLNKKYVSELSGVGKLMPITMVAFGIGALSMIGIPPAAGFLTKWMMLEGALSTDQFFVLGVLLISTALNAYYLLPIVYKAFFEELPKKEKSTKLKEAPWPMVVAITITATASVYLFIDPDAVIGLAGLLVK
jgi:multicomponent Na+:H+ antiporter subunit D